LLQFHTKLALNNHGFFVVLTQSTKKPLVVALSSFICNGDALISFSKSNPTRLRCRAVNNSNRFVVIIFSTLLTPSQEEINTGFLIKLKSTG
jgi:ureidoglycolate hydrolase